MNYFEQIAERLLQPGTFLLVLGAILVYTSGIVARKLFSGSEKADIRSTSGSVQLALHNNLGATVDYRSTSGSFRCDDYRTVNDQITLGDGACKLRVRTTSGNLEITQP